MRTMPADQKATSLESVGFTTPVTCATARNDQTPVVITWNTLTKSSMEEWSLLSSSES